MSGDVAGLLTTQPVRRPTDLVGAWRGAVWVSAFLEKKKRFPRVSGGSTRGGFWAVECTPVAGGAMDWMRSDSAVGYSRSDCLFAYGFSLSLLE